MKSAFNILKKRITFLVLDYNRPENLFLCLESIKKHAKVPHEIITLINGGNQIPAIEMYLNKLTHKLILSDTNEGSSLGILRLVQSCPTENFIFLQSDNILCVDIDEEFCNKIEELLNTRGAIDLTGLVPWLCEYSERAFIMNRDFYLAHDNNTGYGTGPFYNPNFKNSEQTTLDWIKYNNKTIFSFGKHSVIDAGRYSILELPCGGILKRRNDTHQVWVINPPKNKHNCYGINDEEWKLILNNQWVGGTIPKNCEASKFFFYSNELDKIG